MNLVAQTSNSQLVRQLWDQLENQLGNQLWDQLVRQLRNQPRSIK